MPARTTCCRYHLSVQIIPQPLREPARPGLDTSTQEQHSRLLALVSHAAPLCITVMLHCYCCIGKKLQATSLPITYAGLRFCAVHLRVPDGSQMHSRGATIHIAARGAIALSSAAAFTTSNSLACASIGDTHCLQQLAAKLLIRALSNKQNKPANCPQCYVALWARPHTWHHTITIGTVPAAAACSVDSQVTNC